MSEGLLTHQLIKARELTEGRDDLELVRHFIDAAILATRRVHHRP